MSGWVVRYHRLILLVVAVVTLGAVGLLLGPGLRYDYRLEAFVASNDESYRTYRRFMDEFTSNEVAIIAVQTDDALSSASTELVGDLIERLRSLEAVQKVQALAAIGPLVRRLAGERLTEHRLVLDNLLSRDGRTAAIILQMQGEGQTSADRHETVGRLRTIVEEARRDHPEATIIIAGPYVSLIDMYDYVDRDLLVFSVAAFVLLGVTLWVVFRRPGPMIFALLVGGSATACALGTAIVFGFSASLVTQMIVILVTVLSVAGCVHLAVASEETAESGTGQDNASPKNQATRTLGRMLAPCTAVVATTAVGFASVCISSITPVRTFGLLMVCGLAMSLVAAVTGSVLLTGPPKVGLAGRQRLAAVLIGMVRWAERRRMIVAMLFLAAGAVSAAAIGRLRFESDFVKNFRPNSEVRTSYNFIESNLTPVGSMEIVIRTNDGQSILTPQNIRRARELGDAIVERHEPIRKAMSLADLATLVTDGLPATQVDLDNRLKLARTVFGPDFEHNFVNADATALRINLRAVEGIDVDEKLALADEIGAMADDTFGQGFSTQVTGLYYFYAKLVSGLLGDQYRSFGLTLPAVFGMLAIAFRSFKTAAVAMIPNLLPVLFCLGGMGWCGIPVNMTTAMMLAVTLGIAVDDTVHYLWRFRAELARTGDYSTALEATSASVGRACVFTTVVIAGGFWILMLSEFLPTAYFGGLIGFTMLGTLAADLLLLPVLITTFRVFAPMAATADG